MSTSNREFVETFQRFLTEVIGSAQRDNETTPLGQIANDFLGSDTVTLPIVQHSFPPHRLVDADLALAELGSRGGESLIGVSGGQQREHSSFAELLNSGFSRFAAGPVDYVSIPDGPDSTRRVVAFGMHRILFEGIPVVVLQRAAQPQFGRELALVEVLAADPAVSSRFIEELSRLMLSLSVLRGQVLSFSAGDFHNHAAGATFLRRPEVPAEDVVLTAGTLDAIVRHVVGIGEQRERLRAAGQHLKRGVLLYGPPGTGKTLTVRHLLSRTQGTTVILLTGSSIQFITVAAELARAMQPAIVVLEDVDLVAEHRGLHGPQPLLFAVLDALDGLDGDADITFILTTNRVEVLERALAERPGRVDLSVEIPLPDADARRRLFARYAHGLPFSAAAIATSADRAAGTTGSFAKELVRRAVLLAAEEDREPGDADLESALDDLLSDQTHLAQVMARNTEGADDHSSSHHEVTGTYAPPSGQPYLSRLTISSDPS
ncbi:AAA family ATPase [Lacisediminihabitans changchengi]|uniref:ATP-binding protein n=1 Tax=Lacisediminihabitans changchengi TaxID=2787634 RepID=A0A934SMX3_9MICO|nr:AAA family ATPase [Lacisediminihabitans changchengi]MBK4348326.1 ATP-binding protein [Lacisediminihabitans changchengi]